MFNFVASKLELLGPVLNISFTSTFSFDMSVMQVGQLAALRDHFCPIGAVMKWPYRHLYDTEESEKVATRYFAAGQFRARGWTM